MSRAHRSLWALIAVTILAAGLLAQALAAPAGPGADVLVAASALLLLVGGTLLVRVIRYLARTQPEQAAGRRGPNPPPVGQERHHPSAAKPSADAA